MSDKRKDGVIITIKGLQLVTKLTAGAGALVLSAVKVGVGILPEDTDPLTLDDIISYKMDGVIADCGYDSETKNGYVVMQLSNDGLENGFVMTEIGLYAVDPDLGEILYAYVDMSDDPNYIMPAENGRHKLVQLKLHVIVGATKEIEASINPAAQITKEVFDREIQKIVTPDWDDTGEVDGIESFTDFMDSFVKGTSIYQFLTNFKAGLKYVLHTGKLVNSGMCETPGEFALDAAFGKTLQDQITGLYSEIDFKTLLVGQQVRPDKLNTLIDVDITDLYNKRMSGKKSIYEVPYISYIENPVQMCWYYYIGSGRKIFRYAVTRESDLHSAINLNLAILYRDIS